MAKYYSPTGNLEVWDEKPQGYFTVEEWKKMHPIPPYVPTTEEKLAALDAEYTREKATLCEQYTDDTLHDDQEAMAADKEEMAALDAWYDEEYQKLQSEG